MWKRMAWTLLVLLVLIHLSIVLSARALGWQPFLLSPRQWGVTKTENAIVTPHNLVIVEVFRAGCIGLRHRTVYSERVRQLWLGSGRRKQPKPPS
jgi:hypothetical protein